MDEKIYYDTDKVRRLNDLFRRYFTIMTHLGEVFLTNGVEAMETEAKNDLLKKVCEFKNFNEDNDPHNEHDFGEIKHNNETFFFKIDYCDPSMKMGSKHPDDPQKCKRALTIMIASEY